MRTRSIRWWTRLSDSENRKAEALYAKCSLGKEDFVRQAILQGYIEERPSVEYFKLLTEINRIGVNINQIAKIANTDARISTDSIEQIKRLQKEIISFVKEALG